MKLSHRLFAVVFALSAGMAVPVVAAPATSSSAAAKPAATAPAKSKSVSLNINSASAAELTEKLVGVGPKKADAIVAWRKANGGFKTTAQLMEVKGIGPSLYERNKAILSTR